MTYSQINLTKVWGFLLLATLILISGCEVSIFHFKPQRDNCQYGDCVHYCAEEHFDIYWSCVEYCKETFELDIIKDWGINCSEVSGNSPHN